MKNTEYQNWFAWKPVAYGPHISWFVVVQRKWNVEQNCWYYRKVSNKNVSVTRIYRGR